ncbi:MAG TPA: DUF4212 domain-containing protein [Longimicrobiales bacterium]|nr:DUF4212 domain-containing protein [Longimicrobiales bacterium]
MTDRPERGRTRRATSLSEPGVRQRYTAYWRRNIRYVLGLLVVWFVVSYGFGILLAEPLNGVTIPGTGFPLGFWFAQQGSIYVFVVLIFVYVWLMNRLDREFDVDEGEAGPEHRGGGAGARGPDGGDG